MNVTIYYCQRCGFRKHAETIAVALERELGLQTEFREGFWGTFRIEQQGEEIFNRSRTRGILGRLGLGRTPSAEEIVPLFRTRTDPHQATAS